MKKWVVFIISSITVLILLLWWHNEAPVSGGIYPEKHTGLEMVVVDDGDIMVPITLPVRWIKSYPWEKVPTIYEVQLIDEGNDIFASLTGEYKLQIPYPEESKWYDRNILGEIELHLNGAMVAEEWGITTNAIESTLEREFLLNRITLNSKNKRLDFLIENNYRYELITQDTEVESQWQMEGLQYLFVEDDYYVATGFIVRLSGSKGHQLEKIGFWLPGMSNEYYDGSVLYSYNPNTDQYNNSTSEFKGEVLKLPHKIDANSLLIYFPFTKEIMTASGDSLVRLKPYFQFTDVHGASYYAGGVQGSGGPLNRSVPWNEHMYLPNRD
ncbi:hypothetical protein H1D32_18090 [Anaerobacillus sp. CMMVII]|uniref:hypothetical protein n=1 Tax=Anaerobacillus sp. CMMVII TaxID=2755588 RepID=UPI0021B84CC8|nr:hypothetical protein [Anaerobacillus sp. CMMVII]MCT8139446.1 hypothetical protein [Anaerobacillus sp. CMMVII]